MFCKDGLASFASFFSQLFLCLLLRLRDLAQLCFDARTVSFLFGLGALSGRFVRHQLRGRAQLRLTRRLLRAAVSPNEAAATRRRRRTVPMMHETPSSAI